METPPLISPVTTPIWAPLSSIRRNHHIVLDGFSCKVLDSYSQKLKSSRRPVKVHIVAASDTTGITHQDLIFCNDRMLVSDYPITVVGETLSVPEIVQEVLDLQDPKGNWNAIPRVFELVGVPTASPKDEDKTGNDLPTPEIWATVLAMAYLSDCGGWNCRHSAISSLTAAQDWLGKASIGMDYGFWIRKAQQIVCV